MSLLLELEHQVWLVQNMRWLKDTMWQFTNKPNNLGEFGGTQTKSAKISTVSMFIRPCIKDLGNLMKLLFCWLEIKNSIPFFSFPMKYLNLKNVSIFSRTNLPHQVMEFHDHPYPNGTKGYPPQADVLKYLHSYAERFDIKRHIKLSHLVIWFTYLDLRFYY